MLPLCSSLVRSLSFSRGFSSAPSVPSAIRALIYQGSLHEHDVHVFFPDYGFILTKSGFVASNKPLNSYEVTLNDSARCIIETKVVERQLCDEKVESIVQRVMEHKKLKEMDKELLEYCKRYNDFPSLRGRVVLQTDVETFLEGFKGF